MVESEDLEILAPIGTLDKLVIHGPILARGYIEIASTSKSGFLLALRWAGKLGKRRTAGPGKKATQYRSYRTGDLVRY
jgi:hypothetical protein